MSTFLGVLLFESHRDSKFADAAYRRAPPFVISLNRSEIMYLRLAQRLGAVQGPVTGGGNLRHAARACSCQTAPSALCKWRQPEEPRQAVADIHPSSHTQ